ncbi:MAG: hypothetical protein M3O46_07915 [Myxococcota bacterium]|nr:hypothetical protein [Myxococcota bacterium]
MQRAYDGYVVDGRFIEPAAYTAFLRGATAEASGDMKAALGAYADAARMDPKGVEIWTRIGEVRCHIDVRDDQADGSFARALTQDARYAPAWAAKSKCALARGDIVSAREAARPAAQLDPAADGANVLLARTREATQATATRVMLVGLTVTAREPLVAWEALGTWAEGHNDIALLTRALKETARLAPARRDDVAMGAEKLAGAGEIWAARGVAGCAAAAESDGGSVVAGHPLAARLALDDAIAMGGRAAVSARATHMRLPLDEAAGRAFLSGNRSLARELASASASADPTVSGARWVLAATGEIDLFGTARETRSDGDVPSAATFVAFASMLVHAASPEQARAMLATLVHRPIVAGDDLVVRPAVQLASHGAIVAYDLPVDGVVELAALRGQVPPPELLAAGAHGLDARHELLALALSHPDGPRARELSARLGTAAISDPIVAAAAGLMQLASGGPAAAATAQALLARYPGDPLLAEVALRLAKKTGDRDIALRARDALTALGGIFRASVR